MQEHIVIDLGERPAVEIYGQRLGHVSTHVAGKDRWTELTVYSAEQATGGHWLVHAVGRSTVAGEVDRHSLTVCETPKSVVRALSKRGILTDPGYTVIEQAAERDSTLDLYLDEYFDGDVERRR